MNGGERKHMVAGVEGRPAHLAAGRVVTMRRQRSKVVLGGVVAAARRRPSTLKGQQHDGDHDTGGEEADAKPAVPARPQRDPDAQAGRDEQPDGG